MNDLNKRAFEGLAQFILVLGLLLFLSAWTLNYWQAWTFLAVFTLSILFITLYLMKHDPKLLERRLKAGPGAEKEQAQKLIQLIATISFISIIIFPALDHRFDWSTMQPSVSILGDILVALGLLIVFFVFKENTYTSGVIEIASDQQVISTGPYAVVRHPMYSGAFIMLIGMPLALGSWWGLLTVIPIMLVIIWRSVDEETFLIKNLNGYTEYRHRVRSRLVPFIW